MVVLAAALAANAFLNAFGGTWACTQHAPAAGTAVVSHWMIAQAPQSKWAIVRWGYGHDSGTAYVGFLAPDAVG